MTDYLKVGCRMVRKTEEAGSRSLSLSGQDVGILVFFFFSGQEMEWMMTINALQYFLIFLCGNTSLKGFCCGL